MNKNTHTFIGCDCDFRESEIVIFGAPYDGTASYRPGARFGPSAIRGESFGIETFSPYQERDISDLRVCDAGDLELPFGNTRRALDMIENACREILGAGKLPVMLGGEHLVTLGAVRAAAEHYDRLHVIHLDAHADLRDDYLGEELSHATVLRRVWDILGDRRIFQFGIRSGERAEFEFAARHTRMSRFDLRGLDGLRSHLSDEPVYLTLDLDVLDPSVLCGTGTPEAGGISFGELLGGLRSLSGLNIVGCDITELSPVYDASGVSSAVACKLLREILLIIKGE